MIVFSQNENIGAEIYQSAWTDIPVTYQKMLMLIVMQTQNPIQIKTFVASYDFQNFQNVLNAAYGYITYLQTIKN
jgi:hypothetical protein